VTNHLALYLGNQNQTISKIVLSQRLCVLVFLNKDHYLGTFCHLSSGICSVYRQPVTPYRGSMLHSFRFKFVHGFGLETCTHFDKNCFRKSESKAHKSKFHKLLTNAREKQKNSKGRATETSRGIVPACTKVLCSSRLPQIHKSTSVGRKGAGCWEV
jgi:hypothetical protein